MCTVEDDHALRHYQLRMNSPYFSHHDFTARAILGYGHEQLVRSGNLLTCAYYW
jgi:hypothetical protein